MIVSNCNEVRDVAAHFERFSLENKASGVVKLFTWMMCPECEKRCLAPGSIWLTSNSASCSLVPILMRVGLYYAPWDEVDEATWWEPKYGRCYRCCSDEAHLDIDSSDAGRKRKLLSAEQVHFLVMLRWNEEKLAWAMEEGYGIGQTHRFRWQGWDITVSIRKDGVNQYVAVDKVTNERYDWVV